MARIVIISGDGDLDALYRAIMARQDAKYHQFPVNFKDFTLSKQQEMDLKDATDEANRHGHHGEHNGKRVI